MSNLYGEVCCPNQVASERVNLSLVVAHHQLTRKLLPKTDYTAGVKTRFFFLLGPNLLASFNTTGCSLVLLHPLQTQTQFID